VNLKYYTKIKFKCRIIDNKIINRAATVITRSNEHTTESLEEIKRKKHSAYEAHQRNNKRSNNQDDDEYDSSEEEPLRITTSGSLFGSLNTRPSVPMNRYSQQQINTNQNQQTDELPLSNDNFIFAPQPQPPPPNDEFIFAPPPPPNDQSIIALLQRQHFSSTAPTNLIQQFPLTELGNHSSSNRVNTRILNESVGAQQQQQQPQHHDQINPTMADVQRQQPIITRDVEILSINEMLRLSKLPKTDSITNRFPKRQFVFNDGKLLKKYTAILHFWSCENTFNLEFDSDKLIKFTCRFDGCNAYRHIKMGNFCTNE
jgi:hypothetical protein